MNNEGKLQQDLAATILDQLLLHDGTTAGIPNLIIWLQQAGTMFIDDAGNETMCNMIQAALSALLEYVKHHDTELPATFLEWITGVFLPAAMSGSPAQTEMARMFIVIMELSARKNTE